MDVSNLPDIISINCSQNTIATLDFSNNIGINQNTSLTIPFIYCSQNNLSTLNMKNISTNMLTTNYFIATNNPNLTCIDVDDVAAANTTWTNKDATATYNLDCSALSVNEFGLAENISLYPNPAESKNQIDSKETITELNILDVFGKTIEMKLSSYDSVDVSKLSKGIYFLIIKTNKGSVVKKILKN